MYKLDAQLNQTTESLRGDRYPMTHLHHDQSHPKQTDGEDIEIKPTPATTAEVPGTAADAIMLPSRKAAMRRAREVVQKTSEIRQERIDELSQALKVGELILDSQLLADRLVGTQLHDLQSAA
jgi:anti-sigma28 factor (negative regulator of flagellin synthesis)